MALGSRLGPRARVVVVLLAWWSVVATAAAADDDVVALRSWGVDGQTAVVGRLFELRLPSLAPDSVLKVRQQCRPISRSN